MKKIQLLFGFLFICCLYPAQGFDVDSFSADIYLNKEGYFDVVEHYDIHFTEPKHGIIRNIILR